MLVAAAMVFTMCGTKNQNNDKISGKLVVFHAGSLSMPLKAAVESFTRIHPNAKIYLEAAGSVECARKITELRKPCDVFASADYRVIDKLLIPDFASWSIPFAGNEMALVFHDKSKYSDQINVNNWPEILGKNDIAYGRSDPNTDPCGYRTVMTLKLAEQYYQKRGLANEILNKDNKYMRPKEVDLIALLESDVIDYMFLYKSVAVQHGFKYLALPLEINLSSPVFENQYSKVSVDVVGKTPESTVTIIGEPMVYGLTIPKSSRNPELAIEFVKFFLSQNGGMSILKNMGQTPIVPSRTSTFDSIPLPLKVFALK